MRKNVFIASLCFFVFLINAVTAAAAPRLIRLNESDAGTMFELHADTVAVIELDSQPSTGYGWRLGRSLDRRLKILGRQFEPLSSGLLGGWVKEKIYVVAAAEGRANLDLQYRRAFETSSAADLSFSFTVQEIFTESFTIAQPDTTEPADLELMDSLADGLTALPESFNWCDHNGCTPIRNQGSCGACWAFATAAPLESLIKLNDGVTTDLSEQYLISCNIDGWDCDGGFWAHDYHEWKIANGETEAGAVLEEVFPYVALEAYCNPPHDKAYHLDSWHYVCPDCTPTISQLKEAIYEHGPLSVSVCVNTAFQNYQSGVFSGPGCTSLNHGVVLVGWDDGDQCWIMRNSWGTQWGESGYMRIQYGMSAIGSEAAYVVYGDAPDPAPNPDPDPGEGEINNGQTISELSAPRGEWIYYHINVPENISTLHINLSGGSGDADLYTLFGTPPTVSNYDCRPYLNNNDETCTFQAPQAGTWHIGLRAYRDFSGASLTVVYQEEDPEPAFECVTADNLDHISQGRAVQCGWWGACAAGSGDYLGLAMSGVVTSLEKVSDNRWVVTDGCP
jgi:C1A family cysteine protease